MIQAEGDSMMSFCASQALATCLCDTRDHAAVVGSTPLVKGDWRWEQLWGPPTLALEHLRVKSIVKRVEFPGPCSIKARPLRTANVPSSLSVPLLGHLPTSALRKQARAPGLWS